MQFANARVSWASILIVHFAVAEWRRKTAESVREVLRNANFGSLVRVARTCGGLQNY